MLQLSFFVHCYGDYAMQLRCYLAALKCQVVTKDYKIDIHVLDTSKVNNPEFELICKTFVDIHYHKVENAFDGCTRILNTVKTDYVCLTACDNYLVPQFSFIMLETAHRLKSDLVYCDCVYDPRLHGRSTYTVLSTVPELGWIDNACYIFRKTAFKGYPYHAKNWRDGMLAEEFMKRGLKIDKAKGILVFHN
jgi:hypothetical protein